MPWRTLLQVKTNVPDTAEGQQVSETPNRTASVEKTLMLGEIDDRRKRATENEKVGWHHQLDGCEFEQTPGDSEGQGSLACCSPRGCKESDMTKRVNNNQKKRPGLCLRLEDLKGAQQTGSLIPFII